MIAGLPDHVHNAARIRYPMVRVDWMRKGHQSDTSQRGDNRFVRVSGMKRWICSIRNWSGCKTYGPSALLTASGWQSTGMFHNASGMLARAIALHGNSVSTGGDYSTGAAQVILPRVVGSMEVYEQQTSWPLVLQNSKTIVLWGSDMVKNQQANWWCPDHDVYQYYEQLKRRLPAALSRSSASTRSSPPRTIIWGAIRSNISPLTRRRMSRYNWRWRIPCTARNCTIKISSITTASVLTSSSPICWARKMDSPKMPLGGKTVRY